MCFVQFYYYYVSKCNGYEKKPIIYLDYVIALALKIINLSLCNLEISGI